MKQIKENKKKWGKIADGHKVSLEDDTVYTAEDASSDEEGEDKK